jgi:pimeloyl-ACP methyl ester carboxylesterase
MRGDRLYAGSNGLSYGEHPLPLVEAPTLFVGGEHGEARPSTLREFAHRMPNATYRMVPGSGHWVENDRPVEHDKLLRDWLADRA